MTKRTFTSVLILAALLTLALLALLDRPSRIEAAVEVDPAEAASAGPAPGGRDQGDDDTFVPTERLPADSAISFPVDI